MVNGALRRGAKADGDRCERKGQIVDIPNHSCKPSADGLQAEMIRRFRHKGLEALFRTGSVKGIDAQLAAKLRRMLARLNDGPLPDAMSLPGYRLHQLKGDRKGSWSVWVSANYRLIFDIEGEDATNVDFGDYH